MRIVSVGPAPPWRGGIAQYHLALVDALRRSHHEVEVIGFRSLYPRLLFPGSDQLDPTERASPPVGRQVLRPLGPWTWARAARLADRHGPELVLFQWWHPFFAPAYLGMVSALRTDALVGMVCHNVDPHEGMPLGGWLTRRVLRHTDVAVTGGSGMADRIAVLAPGVRTAVVGHPAYDLPDGDHRPDRSTARASLGIGPDEVVFLFFGLVRAYKGLDVLIDALALLDRERPWRALVVGEFYQDRAPYDAQLARAGLTGRVLVEDRFIPRAEAPLYFAAADLVVLPYRDATQSGVAALAFSQGRPVLSTSVGALPETVREGVNGWLVPPGDPVALAERMGAVLAEPATARLPVCEGQTGIPTWDDLARAVVSVASNGP